MIFAQFYQKSATSDSIIEACGDRSVVILDGRSNLRTHRALAREECIKRKFLGYSLHRGSSFSRSLLIERIRLVTEGPK